MATYAQPYQSQHYAHRSTYPPLQSAPVSSQSSWARGGTAAAVAAPPPVPYAGAPPPIPAGVSVNPQQWQAGSWQINPAYRHPANAPAQQQHVPWIPSHHWTQQYQPPAQHQQQPYQQQAAQQQASYNPYKRVPKPPSKEYLETELSANPLGLENMVPASVEEYYRRGHQTPWIWKPRDLDDDESSANGSTSTNAPRLHTDGDITHQSSEPESFTAKRELQPTFSSKIVRTPEHYRNTPSPKRAGSYSSIDSSLSSRMSSFSLGTGETCSPTPLSRQSTMPTSLGSSSSSSSTSSYLWSNSASPTKREFGAAAQPMLADQLSEEPDSMLSPLVLAKTPLLPARTVRNHPNPLLSTQSLDTIPEGPARQSSLNSTVRAPEHIKYYPPQQQQQQPAVGGGGGGGGVGTNGNYYSSSSSSLQHAHTMPNLPKSQYIYPSNSHSRHQKAEDWELEREREEREKDRERERERERGLGSRHTTYVDPHLPLSANANATMNAKTPSPRNHVPSHPSSAHASPTNITPPNYPTSPPHQQSQPYAYPQQHAHTAYPSPSATVTSPASHTVFSPTSSLSSSTGPSSRPSHTSPSSSSTAVAPTNSNPLPPPPQLPTRPPILPTPRTPPAKYNTRMRRGFWNRRGDHLTADGYIVYAPASQAYPNDLVSYPDEGVGYQDHHGLFTAHMARPELPQSLPRWGREPECPYEKFVVYEYT